MFTSRVLNSARRYATMSTETFSKLIRFTTPTGSVQYGQPVDDSLTSARIITGDIFGSYRIAPTPTPVSRILAPLAPAATRTVRCLGLNYAKHAEETKMPKPAQPVLFYKPVTALGNPEDPIPVPLAAQKEQGLDYECELVIVIGKPARDVRAEEALDYVLGYSVGNDVSHRDLQLKRGGGQWGNGKSFDGWAPWGPVITAQKVLGDGSGLRIKTRVNGETLQDESTSDLIFGVKETIAFLSQGTTLLPGDVIFTGTPAGVGMGRTPNRWLVDGDVVEVELDGVGVCRNKVVFEKKAEKAKL